jgi:multiple antibiotic resistance protein
MYLQDAHHFTSVVLLAIAALFPLVDPLGGAPLYLAMVTSLSPADKVRTARLVAINSFFVMTVAVLIGAYVLDVFGISIPAVQVGGGLIVCAVGWSFLMTPGSPAISDRTSTADPDMLSQRAFYPLTLPLTVGPGSISVAITLGANSPREIRSLFTTALAHVIGIFIVAVSIYVCYRYAERILSKLGRTGTTVLTRFSAFTLFCIGVQIISNGLRAMLSTVLHGSISN